MFDKIVNINDRFATVSLMEGTNATINLMNLHIIFEDDFKTILGEVDDLNGDLVKVRFLGEVVDNKLLSGIIRKPALDSKVRVISENEIPLIVGSDEKGFLKFGVSPFYNDYPIFIDVNSFFGNHFAIFGNSGSGKSCGISRLFQNMFHDDRLFPYKANIFLFDSSSEYYNAFNNLNSINTNYNYRFYSTNELNDNAEKLRIPIFLLNVNDLALLLHATSHSQLSIIERMLKLALVFSQNDKNANDYKNYLIAKAIMTVLYTNETSPNKRNEIFSILASCTTPQFNLEAVVQGVGYKRKFRECFLIDSQGQFSENVLLTDYVSSFIRPEFENYEPYNKNVYYSLQTLEKALNFTLISEGWLRNKNTYADAITLKVRLHSLIVGPNSKFFDYPKYVTLETYLSNFLINDDRKYQIININFDDIDDDLAKVITKIFSRLVFDFSKCLTERASIPFHLVIEEAHRYVQNDDDRFLFGYNIFERIAKEGRKYGVILGLISQRPVELLETVISQCSNFMIFKINHPVDVDYIRKMVPNISEEIVEKQKSLQSGTCLGFGVAFRIPLIIKMQLPDPLPWSSNCDVVTIWNGNTVSKPIQIRKSDDLIKNSSFVDKNQFSQFAVQDYERSDKDMITSINNEGEIVPSVYQGINNHLKAQLPSIDLKKNTSLGKENEKKASIVGLNNENLNNISIPIVPTGNKVDIPKIPKGMNPETTFKNDSSENGMTFNFEKSENKKEEKEKTLLSEDKDNNGKIKFPINLFENMNDKNIDKKSDNFKINDVQTSIPDFTMTSAQEREFSIPTNSYSIPSSYSMINQSEVKPTVDVNSDDDDYGKVKVVPPTQHDDSLNNEVKFSRENNEFGIPMTDDGMPLINLIG